MNAGVFQDNENADDEDNIGSDLRDCVLQRAIETAVNEEAIKEKTLRPRRNPKDEDKQANEEKNLQQADGNPGYRRTPGEGNAEAVDRADRKENERCDAQDRRDDRDEVGVELEAAEESP